MFDSAIEGARFAALADQEASSGCARAELLFKKSLGTAINPTFRCDESEVGSRKVILVSLEAVLPGLGFLPNNFKFKAVGHATSELQ
jgi:hypothetical protein